MISRSKVVLPAPLGPRRPKTEPSGISKETWSRARIALNRLESELIEIMGYGRHSGWVGPPDRARFFCRRLRPGSAREFLSDREAIGLEPMQQGSRGISLL